MNDQAIQDACAFLSTLREKKPFPDEQDDQYYAALCRYIIAAYPQLSAKDVFLAADTARVSLGGGPFGPVEYCRNMENWNGPGIYRPAKRFCTTLGCVGSVNANGGECPGGCIPPLAQRVAATQPNHEPTTTQVSLSGGA